ncbi:MAG: putative glycoside hydrolase [Anaerolineae bacterium]
MRRWPLFLTIAALVFLASAAPASAPRRPAADATPATGPHPQAVGKADRTGYIKGIYISYGAMGNADFMRSIQDLLENTEINAVVLDFKGDRGLLSFPSQVPAAIGIGAAQAPVVSDPAVFLSWFKQRDIYTIARIVTFKDNLLAQARPDWAITDAKTGRVWRDHEGMGWVDPFREAPWDYNTALALEAARLGFDEVQFDYIRFPTDGSISSARYAQPNTQENRTAAIAGLLKLARQATFPLGTRLSIDTFGYASWVPDDLGIGQHIESLAPLVDVLAPMLYPSTFNAGLPGASAQYRNAIAYPYEIVNQSTQRTLARAQAVNPDIEVRPWLQDFKDYAFDGRRYTPAQMRRQMDGARDAGGRGWMLWDPAVRYTREALVSASPSYVPNPSGRVLVVAYRDFALPAIPTALSPEALRADLQTLLDAGFYPINLRDLTEGKLSMVPAGKRPVALTFDGASLEQFRLLSGGTVDPDCAVGVLLAMNADHPADWPLRATFFVRLGEEGAASPAFGTADLTESKLQLLIAWGMEVGVQPPPAVTSAALQDVLAQATAQLAVWLPDYRLATLAWPGDEQLSETPWETAGPPDPPARAFTGAVLTGGGLAPAPTAPDFDPYRVPRVPAHALALWLAQVDKVGVHYVSGGE